jgi:hypothetical protein
VEVNTILLAHEHSRQRPCCQVCMIFSVNCQKIPEKF